MDGSKITNPILTIYTDGACSGNPGPGGWGAVLIWNGHVKEISGGEKHTTNNRMELIATIEALRVLKRKSEISLYTDSTYVKNGITQWIFRWKRSDWKLSNRKGNVKNVDLWKELDRLNSLHQVHWKWVKGHSGNEWNERADELARNAIPGASS